MTITTRNIPIKTAEALISAATREVLNGLRLVFVESTQFGSVRRAIVESREDGRLWAYEYRLTPIGVDIVAKGAIVEARQVFAVQRIVTRYENQPLPPGAGVNPPPQIGE